MVSAPEGMTCCPHCGGETFHVRLRVYGSIREHHRFDGQEAGNEGMWDSVVTKNSNVIYCSDCDRRIGVAADPARQSG